MDCDTTRLCTSTSLAVIVAPFVSARTILAARRRVIIVPRRRDVARIIDYDMVLERMSAQGFVSLYHNSGAFAFARQTETQMVGWIGLDDPTLLPAARQASIAVPPPYEQ